MRICFKYFTHILHMLFMHYIELSHASHTLIIEAHTNFKLSGGLAAYLTTVSQGLSLCKPQLFAECLDW